MTLVALALRLSDRLVAEFKNGVHDSKVEEPQKEAASQSAAA